MINSIALPLQCLIEKQSNREWYYCVGRSIPKSSLLKFEKVFLSTAKNLSVSWLFPIGKLQKTLSIMFVFWYFLTREKKKKLWIFAVIKLVVGKDQMKQKT